MPRCKKVYGWIDGGRIAASQQPKAVNGAINYYEKPSDLVRDASARGMTVEWENPAEVDQWRAR